MKWKNSMLLPVFFIALTPALFAQFAPAKLVHRDTLTDIYSPWHIVDWDGDGDMDILFASEHIENPDIFHTSLLWMEGDGSGHFAHPRVWEPTMHSEFLLGDMNGDGLPDLVFHPENSQSVVWRANLGGVPGSLETVSDDTYKIVAVVDWDGDGDNDVVEQNRWIENEGQGVFANYYPIIIQSIYYSVIGGLDANGEQDILSASDESGTILLLHENKSGVFVDSITIDPQVKGFDKSFAVDMDADGDLDIVLYLLDSIYRQTCYWYTNEGAGQFGPRKEIFDPTLISTIAINAAPVDMDNDGLPDILCSVLDTFEQKSHIAWFHNLGAGQFDVRMTDVLGYAFDIHAEDITGDGAKDILFNTAALLVAENKGDGSFFERASIYPHAAKSGSISAADVDNDGDLDLCFVSDLTGNIGWWPNDGAGHFGPPNVVDQVYEPYFYLAPTPFNCADLDGDGWNDFILNTGIVAYVWLGTGGGQFAAPDTFLMDDPWLTLPKLADADGDGDLDVVSATQDTSIWYPNDGSGMFGPVVSNIPASYDETSDCYGDIDGDGDRDLIVRAFHFNLNYTTQAIYWKSNLGNGLYGPYQLIVDFPAPTYYYAGIPACARDMDTDGDVDVAIGASWYENDGTGHGWIPHNNGNGYVGPGNNPNDYLQYQDFDKDGDVDIFSTYPDISSGDRNMAQLVLNNGTGNFTAGYSAILPFKTSNVQIFSRDLDNDGDFDVIFYRNGVVGWLENVAAAPPILARAFFDENGNGVQDSVDAPLSGVGIRLDPGAVIAFTDEQGLARFFVDTGFYQITYLPDDCRFLSTDSATYTVEMPFQGPTRVFGFRPDSTQIGMKVLLASAPTRCGFVVPFWAAVRNTGCIQQPATFALKIDPLISIVNADPPPDIVQEDSLVWHWTDPLLPGETRYIQMQLQMPGSEHQGETLHFTGQSWPTGIPGLTDTLHLNPVISCAYDPNDKLVNLPEVPADYTPAISELVYTIRFQNTGADTAFTIQVRDTLDARLDWNSFRPLSASHSFESGINLTNGEVVFKFEHIALADSNVNELASHGYTQFAVRLKSGLEPGTKVFNTAAIYFDFNPPIFTNTAETKVQTPVSVSTYPGPDWLVSISPNPNNGDFSVELQEPATPGMRCRIIDLTGRLTLEKRTETGRKQQQVQAGSLPAGLYFLQVVSEGKITAVEKFVKQ